MISTLNYSTRYTLHYTVNSYVILDNIYLLNFAVILDEKSKFIVQSIF